MLLINATITLAAATQEIALLLAHALRAHQFFAVMELASKTECSAKLCPLATQPLQSDALIWLVPLLLKPALLLMFAHKVLLLVKMVLAHLTQLDASQSHAHLILATSALMVSVFLTTLTATSKPTLALPTSH
jgi:hypothetical protein